MGIDIDKLDQVFKMLQNSHLMIKILRLDYKKSHAQVSRLRFYTQEIKQAMR